MTKEITKAFILQEMQDKFKLRELEPEIFSFSETVIPVYNIEQHLERWIGKYYGKGITGTGAIMLFEVPDNEKHTLWRYDVVFMGPGAFTLAGIYTKRNGDAVTDFCYLDLGSGKSTSYHIDLPVPLILMPGDKVYANVDGFTSNQNLRLYVDYKVEEVR